MNFYKDSLEWKSIIAKHSTWFSESNLSFWNSKVLWSTLTPVGDDEWLFLSLEDNFDRSKQMYSVRFVSNETIDTLSFQQTSDKKRALILLHKHTVELQNRGN